MPRYTPETARAKAESLAKPLMRNGFNKSKTARQLGITPQAVNDRLKHKPVQDALQRYIDSPKLKAKLIKVAEEGLSAKQYDMIGKPHPNHSARHRFWHDLLTAGGVLKTNGDVSGVKIINIVHAYRKEKNADSGN